MLVARSFLVFGCFKVLNMIRIVVSSDDTTINANNEKDIIRFLDVLHNHAAKKFFTVFMRDCQILDYCNFSCRMFSQDTNNCNCTKHLHLFHQETEARGQVQFHGALDLNMKESPS